MLVNASARAMLQTPASQLSRLPAHMLHFRRSSTLAAVRQLPATLITRWKRVCPWEETGDVDLKGNKHRS